MGKARKQLALDYITELERLDAQRKDLKKQISNIVEEKNTSLVEVAGIGNLGASKVDGEVLDVRRLPSKAHFASCTGSAPVDVSSGENNRHRLNRSGNRRLNHVLHIAADTQAGCPAPDRTTTDANEPPAKTHLEALRCLKRRISDVVFRCLTADQTAMSPGGQVGASLQSSATDPIPMAGTSEQSLPGLTDDHTPPIAAAS